jgi:glycosyltransferase involved in cell wall biosynthesis
MRWLIKNPAPSDSRRTKWGDYHFGRSLSKYLVRLGHEVQTQYDPGWGEDAPCDIVLVLRGKYPFPPSPAHRDALRVMWNISHPSDVGFEEYETYDLVFVGSRSWAERLQTEIETPVRPLLQCTDLEEFNSPLVEDVTGRKDIVFIGNTRDVQRPGVLWAVEYGLPVKIWGRGWDHWSAGDHVVADYYPNEDLGSLYSRSRATLNDHWDDMKEYGYVNNRIFDAIACGLPVISDWHSELQTMFPRGILLYRNKGEFVACIEELLLDYPSVFEQVRQLGVRVRDEFSFERRAADLVRAVDGLRSS